jgi:hypothetical protein
VLTLVAAPVAEGNTQLPSEILNDSAERSLDVYPLFFEFDADSIVV